MSALAFGPLRSLKAEDIRWLVYHTTGTPNGEDTTAAAVHRYHRRELG